MDLMGGIKQKEVAQPEGYGRRGGANYPVKNQYGLAHTGKSGS